jgi:hypothetical protein
MDVETKEAKPDQPVRQINKYKNNTLKIDLLRTQSQEVDFKQL